MESYSYITLRQRPELKDHAAKWFHSKWGVPTQAYLECMEAYLAKKTEYGWYLCMDGDKIVGGMGVIENDFHVFTRDTDGSFCVWYREMVNRICPECIFIAKFIYFLLVQFAPA